MERRDKLAKSDGPGSSELVVTGYQSKDVPGVWPYVLELVEKAVRDGLGQHSAEDIFEGLTTCDKRGPLMQLWLAHTDREILGVCITEINNFPSQRSCVVLYTAGSQLDKWLEPLHTVISAWARKNDCDNVLAFVWRPGLQRLLKAWKKGPSLMILELNK